MESNSKKLKTVIVGCGGFSRNYLGVYRHIPNLEVVACVDADASSAKAMADQLGCLHYSDKFSDAVEAKADYCVLSTPNFLHVEQATALLTSGKHVLLQKPMARHYKESQVLFDLQRKQPDIRLGLYMSMLDFGLWWELKEKLLSEKNLGHITQVSMRLGHTGGLLWNKQGVDLWRFSKDKTGGGAFIMLGVHYIHFLRWLLGLRITKVLAQTANLHCPKVEGEDICQFQGELDNGAFVQLSVSWNSQGEHLSIYGTEGSLIYLDNEHLRIHSSRPWQTSYFDYNTPGKWQNFPNVIPPKLDAPDNPYNQHRSFAESIRSGDPLAVETIEGLWDMQVTQAVYESAKSGQWEVVQYV